MIITNNPSVREHYMTRQTVVIVDGGYRDVLMQARDRIHRGHPLLTHPLMGSLKPNETPYRSVILGDELLAGTDADSVLIIEEAILVFDRFAARHGLSFAPGVKKSLAESLPLSTIALRGELEKILLLAGGEKTIQPGHLTALDVEEAFDLFAFLRSLQTPTGRRDAWDRLLNDPAMAGGDMVFPVSSLMLREARQLWQLLHGEDGKVQLYPSLKTEKKRLAQRLGAPRISRFWDIVLQADTDIKTGRLKPAQAMENLVKEAARLW